ncbi:unnamed protein product [Wuchereria bancrofti]|uniref:Uncharacterized protein n=1 Tax=Wuchereria bancrofti TaxID=6293 RepID=A0A3P7G7F8_WUCBA|nr:unnamed protein product [Wuchereria bancrofti]
MYTNDLSKENFEKQNTSQSQQRNKDTPVNESGISSIIDVSVIERSDWPLRSGSENFQENSRNYKW